MGGFGDEVMSSAPIYQNTHTRTAIVMKTQVRARRRHERISALARTQVVRRFIVWYLSICSNERDIKTTEHVKRGAPGREESERGDCY